MTEEKLNRANKLKEQKNFYSRLHGALESMNIGAVTLYFNGLSKPITLEDNAPLLDGIAEHLYGLIDEKLDEIEEEFNEL